VSDLPPQPFHNFIVGDQPPFSHLLKAFANQSVLIFVQCNVVAYGFIDQIAASPVLRSRQRIEGIDFVGFGAKAYGLFRLAHNTDNIAGITLYYKTQLEFTGKSS
jgi:hypothetical protein